MANTNFKSLTVILAVCVLVLSGCGSKENSKLSKENQFTEITQISAEKLEKENVDSKKNQMPFQLYMEKYKKQLPDASEWKSADGSYRYPFTLEEWKQIDSWEEKYAVCQIPDKILGELDAPALLKLVLECPALSNITYHDSYYEGVRQLAKDFNGMYELQNRSDFYETVLNYYKNLKISSRDKSNLKKHLPNNSKSDEYASVLKDDKLMAKVREDIRLENTINFCLAVLGGMTENVSQNVLERAGHVLSTRFDEIETSDYRDGVMTREALKSAAWADKKVSAHMDAPEKSKK